MPKGVYERTEWHKIGAWRKLGEICGEYLSKGKQVYIEGRLQTRSWEDRDGNKRFTTEIVANNMQMLGRLGMEKEISEEVPIPKDSELNTEEEDIPF